MLRYHAFWLACSSSTHILRSPWVQLLQQRAHHALEFSCIHVGFVCESCHELHKVKSWRKFNIERPPGYWGFGKEALSFLVIALQSDILSQSPKETLIDQSAVHFRSHHSVLFSCSPSVSHHYVLGVRYITIRTEHAAVLPIIWCTKNSWHPETAESRGQLGFPVSRSI